MKKKVLLIINTPFSNAGVPHVIMSIVKELSNEYIFDLLIYSSSDEIGDRENEFLSYGGNIYKLKTLEYSDHKFRFFTRYFRISSEVKRLIKEHHYDIVHCHNGVEAGTVLRVAKHTGVPVRISHAHGLYNRKGRNYILRFYNWLNKRMISKCSTFRVACSDGAGKSMYLHDDFLNVFNPVDVSYYSDIVHENQNKINLIQIGYFCNNKNQLMSLKVLKGLIDSGVDAQITLIGFIADDNYYSQLLRFIEENNLSKQVFILEKNADKKLCFSTSDFLLLPSYSEGLSITTLEAQAAGIKCLVSESVPHDCDCGLVTFLNNQDINAWISTICMSKDVSMEIDKEKMKKVDIKGYCQIIRDVYK